MMMDSKQFSEEGHKGFVVPDGKFRFLEMFESLAVVLASRRSTIEPVCRGQGFGEGFSG